MLPSVRSPGSPGRQDMKTFATTRSRSQPFITTTSVRTPRLAGTDGPSTPRWHNDPAGQAGKEPSARGQYTRACGSDKAGGAKLMNATDPPAPNAPLGPRFAPVAWHAWGEPSANVPLGWGTTLLDPRSVPSESAGGSPTWYRRDRAEAALSYIADRRVPGQVPNPLRSGS